MICNVYYTNKTERGVIVVGLKERNQLKTKQGVKRRKKRKKLAEQGLNPDDFFTNGIYVGTKLIKE
ncbi:MAG: hypothetical protein ABH869_04760 [Candidatus Omnitrophota bacterium]